MAYAQPSIIGVQPSSHYEDDEKVANVHKKLKRLKRIYLQNHYTEPQRKEVNKHSNEDKLENLSLVRKGHTWSRLHLNAASLNLDELKSLLNKGSSIIDQRDEKVRTPLMCVGLEASTLVSLQSEDPSLLKFPRKLESALEMVQYLVDTKNQTIPDTHEGGSTTFIHKAIKREDLDLLHYLIEKSLLRLNWRDSHGHTPLHVCARRKSSATLKMIVSLCSDHDFFKAALEIRDKDGLTPTALAMLMGWHEGVQEFIDAGASVPLKSLSIYNNDQLTSFIELVEFKLENLVVDRGQKQQPRNMFQALSILGTSGPMDVQREQAKAHRGPVVLRKKYELEVKTEWARKWKKSEEGYRRIHIYKANHRFVLHVAAAYLRVDMVTELVNNVGMKLHEKDEKGRTPLMCAGLGASLMIEKEDPDQREIRPITSAKEVVQCLLEVDTKKQCVPETSEGKTTLIHKAVKREDIDLLEYLIEGDILRLTWTDNHGHNVLHVCARRKSLKSLETILLKDLDLLKEAMELRDKDGLTPFTLAVVMGWTEGAQLLLDRGASIPTNNVNGYNVLHMALCSSNRMANIVIKQLFKDNMMETILIDTDNEQLVPIYYAIESRSFGIVQSLGEHDKENKSYQVEQCGYNVLHHAAIYTDSIFECIDYLHLKDDSIKAFLHQRTTKDNNKGLYGTPLHVAAWYGILSSVLEFVTLFNMYNIPLDILDDKGRCALHMAATQGRNKVVKFMVKKNSELLKSRDKYDCTPLITAIANKRESTVKLLLDLGSNLGETISKDFSSILFPEEIKYEPIITEYGINCGSLDGEVKSVELILKYLNPRFLSDQFDSCIKSVAEDETGSFVELDYSILQSHDGSWFDIVSSLNDHHKIMKHLLVESFAYHGTKEMRHTIYFNSLIHFEFLWCFYMIHQYWEYYESTTVANIIGLVIFFTWLTFIYLQDLYKHVKKSTSFFISAALFCFLVLAMGLTVSRFFTTSQVVTRILGLLYYPVLLRVVSYYDQAICTTLLQTAVTVIKGSIIIAAGVVMLFILLFMRPVPCDLLNDYGKWAITYLDKLYKPIIDEMSLETIMTMGGTLVTVWHFLSQVNLHIDFIDKYFHPKRKLGRVDAINRQASVLESLSRSFFFNESIKNTSIKVYHNRKIDDKFHGSKMFGNRIWDCVAEWYSKQTDSKMEKDKEKFKVSMNKCPVHNCSCEVESTKKVIEK